MVSKALEASYAQVMHGFDPKASGPQMFYILDVTHSHIQTYTQAYIHTDIYTQTYTQAYIHLHTDVHTGIHTYRHLHTDRHTGIHTYRHNHTDRHTGIHTYRHIHTDRHTCILPTPGGGTRHQQMAPASYFPGRNSPGLIFLSKYCTTLLNSYFFHSMP